MSAVSTLALLTALVGFVLLERADLNKNVNRVARIDSLVVSARELSLYVQYNAHDTNAYTLGHLEHIQEFREHREQFRRTLSEIEPGASSSDSEGGHAAHPNHLDDRDILLALDSIRLTRGRYDRAASRLFQAADRNRRVPTPRNQEREDAAWEATDVLGDELDQESQELARALRTEAGALQTQVSDRNERIIWIVSGLALVIGFLIILIQIGVDRAKKAAESARRSTEDVLAQNQSILNSAGDGIYGLDPDGRITFVNPAASSLTGFRTDELSGQHGHSTLHHSRADGSPYPVNECPITGTLKDGVAHTGGDDIYWRKDGTSFPIEYTSTPLRDNGKVTGAVVVFKDVTERREMERMKDEFISVVSHELRTPLTSIRGSLGLLESGTLGELPDKGRRMVEIAVSNTDRLVRLINDILDIERIESGRVTMETQRLSTAELVEGAVEGVGSMANEGGVRIETAVEADEVMADGDRMTQVLTNLLSNAIKFSPPDSVVRVSSERQHRQVRLTVSDEGRGIPAERLETIFERFQQVDATDSRQKGGTGLGLAIARTIVHQHGGEIWAESPEGQGSNFCFTLPLAERERTTVADHDGAGARVLICDDDPSVVEVIASMVNERGYAAIPATSGREAVELALKQTPDVVVLDMLMPEMSGWEVAAALNERPETAAIPLVILSVLAAKEAEQPEDVVEWLEKPPSEEVLFRALETALAPRGERPRVLVVEDDLDLAGVLTETFERRGLEVFHAVDGGEAIELSERIRPDLLVLDLVLPQTDGFEVVDWLRHHDRLKSVPIMVYTAKDLDAEERHRLQGAGTQVFTKSRVAPDQFEQRVMQLLRQITGAPRTEANGAEANPDRR